MKQFYYFIIFLFSVSSFSQNFADTKGELQISSSGTAVYTFPIAVPPSIKSVAPTINLVYSSGVRGGIAGQGWSINSISTISRIATRRDIDGYVDGVDFDGNDKLALDGQRLLLKSGVYWGANSTYETEFKSNTRIELKIEGTTTYFVITAPDGSRSWYGSKGTGSLQNSVSVNSWYIVRYEDVDGNFIDYNYKIVTYNSTNQLYIDNIIFSGNTTAGITAQNKIIFNYEAAKRVERDYLNGAVIYANQILKNVEVYTSNAIFRTYRLTHTVDDSGYERVQNIKEINAQNEESNPIVFEYNNTPTSTTRTVKEYTNNLDFSETETAGDFDGDGRLDFVSGNQIFTNLFNGDGGNNPISFNFGSYKKKIVGTTLLNNQINQSHSIIAVNPASNSKEFQIYNLINNTLQLGYTKNFTTDTQEFLHTTDIVSFTNVNYNQGNLDYCYVPQEETIQSSFLEGDFNGDGLSEMLIINRKRKWHKLQTIYQLTTPGGGFGGTRCDIIIEPNGEDIYLADLTPNGSTVLGSKGFIKMINILGDNNFGGYLGDFNGDGKTDILSISPTSPSYPIAYYKIISVKQLDTAPWAEFEIIGSGILDKYSQTKQMLLGDYNGDGKTDIMLPDSEGGEGQVKWHLYYSNANSTGTEFFTKESYDIVEYRPDTSKEADPFKTQVHLSNYYAIDINKDGKSDLVRVWRKYYKPEWTINDHDTKWRVTAFTNNIGKIGASGFSQTYDSNNDHILPIVGPSEFYSDSPEIPIPLVSNYKYNGANTDLVIVRGHSNKIEYYQFNKNFDTDNRLKSATESNGKIIQSIDYKLMEPTDGILGNKNNDFYSSANAVSYPNIEIIKNSTCYLVSKLTATINGISKFQDFRYRGYVSNFNYGTVGFTRTSRSSWYLSEGDTKIWTTQYNDPLLRGANTISWTSTNSSTVFDATPTGLLTTKTNDFSVYTKGGSGDAVYSSPVQDNINITTPVTAGQTYKAGTSIVASSKIENDLAVNYYAPEIILKPGFTASSYNNNKFIASPSTSASQSSGAANSNSSTYNVLLNKQIIQDHLTGVKTETSFTYDGTADSNNYYGLEVRSVTKKYSGSLLQGTIITDTEYDNNPAGAGNAYYVGRPKKISTSTNNAASGDTRTSEEIYTYTGFNLTKTEKKGHNTYFIVEDMSYDNLGNLLTKTVSAPGAPAPVPAARMISDEYDASKRFVIKKIDHQGFITNLAYNHWGQMTKSTDYMGVVSDFAYDNWGKLINSTVTGSSGTPISTTITYAKLSSGGYTVTTTNNLDAKTVVEYDVLGRAIKNSTKGFAANTMITKQVVYDGLGRKQKESEPYFSAPNLWTNYEYDFLMRPITITAPTGKVQTLSYSVLTTTSTDDGKVTTVTIDALGNKIQSTDPGGTINFTYFANGQLKESDYQGNKVKVDIDGWGNKIKMEDPSAGIYTYSYDAFGQLKTETTPNGTTAFVYDAAGKTTEKTIVGTLTNSKTTYAYNGLNQVTSSTYIDNIESKTTTNVYEYDLLKRLYKTTETTPYAIFVKQLTFDNLGRIEKETSTATASGKTSSKTVKKSYQNGFPWQILDDDTQQVLWQTNTLNERGQLLTAVFGNSIGVTNTYDQYGYIKQIKHDKTTPVALNIMTLNTDFEIKRGNLNSRTNSLFGRNENFKYDGLDRLIEYTNGLGIQETQTYDDRGRIVQNSIGNYEYDTAKTYQNKSITPSAEALGYYGMREGIFNDSMEDRAGFGEVHYPSDIFYSYDNTFSHTGKNSLKLANTTSSEKYVHGDKWIAINNSADTQYTYSAWVYADSAQAQMFLFMKTDTETGYFSLIDDTVTDVKNQWIKIEKTFTVPAHIKKLNIRLDNNGLGNVWFDDVQIRKTSDAAVSTRALNVIYNTFKSPVEIEETGVDKISFTYNNGNDRSSMFYGGLQVNKLERTFRKHYSADGTMEVKHNTVTGAVEFVTYIGGDGYSAPIVLKSDGIAQNYLYLHRDYQGTITAVSDQTGTVVEKRLFDAWGNIVKVQDGAGNILSGLTILDRGYTGHEHLQSIGIIHMNGRLYDPKLRRFLQPDNYIQDPFNTQNYNKYGYVLNNPLKYTDSSGEAYELLIAVGVGVAIAVTSYTLTALLADVPFNVGGLVKSAFIGAASSAVTFGIGSAAGTIANFYIRTAVSAVAHGTFQGTMTSISGGKFWSGFASGAISSIASSAFGKGFNYDGLNANGNMINPTQVWGGAGSISQSSLGMIAFGTVSGGVGAQLTGGNFWQGAVTGLVVSGLNHAMHKIEHRRTILSRFKNKSLAFQKADVSDEGIANLHQNVDGLKESYQAGNSPTHSYDLEGNDYLAITENGNVNLNRGLISDKNNLYFAGVLFHEYRHAFQYFAPYNVGGKMYASRYDAWTELYGPGIAGERGRWDMMELDAYSAQYRIGDNQPYVLERVNKYYKYMLQLNWKR